MSITIHAAHKEGSLFVTNERAAAQRSANGDKQGRKTLFAGDLMMKPDSIQMKREQARKQALKVVGDAFKGEKKGDEAMDQMAARKQELFDEAGNCKADLKEVAKEKEALAEVCSSYHDDKEEEDLALLRKERDDEKMRKMNPGASTQLTKEEQEKLAQIHANGLSEWQKGMLSMDELEEREKMNQQKIQANQNAVLAISQAMGDALVESLQEAPMLDATKTADSIMEAANKEIIGDLVAEGKEHIEEKLEEEKEKAKEKEEKEKEEEEKIEKREEKEALQEEMIEKAKAEAEGREPETQSHQKKTSSHGPEVNASEIETMSSYNAEKPSTDKELENILNKMKLIEDDLKGALVDAGV